MKRRTGEFGQEIGLGDLPEDIQAERDRVADITGLTRSISNRSDALGDLRYQDSARRKPKSLGTIPFSGEVISTYDSRPINAIDFSHTSLETWPLTAVSTDPTIVTSTYVVLGGYIGVMRGYRYEMKPSVPINYDDLFLDIIIDGVSQLGYRSLMHGQALSNFVPCFLLADSGASIVIQIRAPGGINSVVGDVRKISVEIYGNLIQTTGAPLQLEIANKEIGLPTKAKGAPTTTANAGGRAMQSILRSRARTPRRFRFF